MDTDSPVKKPLITPQRVWTLILCGVAGWIVTEAYEAGRREVKLASDTEPSSVSEVEPGKPDENQEDPE